MTKAYQNSAGRQLELALEEPAHHFDRLHTAAHGVVLLWERLAEGRRWTKIHPRSGSAPAILSEHAGGHDRYMSVNEFQHWRVVRQLRSLRACFVDIDGFTDPNHALALLTDAGVPAPTMMVLSGRGLHFYWEIDPVPPQALPVWQRVQSRLVELVAAAGLPVDKAVKDCTRVLRLIGSVNSKTGDEVRGLVLKPWRWSLRTLSDEVLGFRPKAEVRSLDAARVRAGRQSKTGSIYDWWHLVYRDLITVADAHLLGIPEGRRDAWLFLYAVSLSWFAAPDTLASEVESVAKSHTPGLTIAEIRKAIAPNLDRAMRAAAGDTITWAGQEVDPRYRFKRQTLLDWLGDLIPPDLIDSLRALVPDEVRQQRRDASRQARNLSRFDDHYTGQGVRAGNEDKAVSARLMVAAGKTQRQIAEALKVSQMTVSRWTRNPVDNDC